MSKVHTILTYGVVAALAGGVLYINHMHLERNEALRMEVTELRKRDRINRDLLVDKIAVVANKVGTLEQTNYPSIPMDRLAQSVVGVNTMGSQGSGFIIEVRGRRLILTNYHVVQNHPDTTISVTTHDGARFSKVNGVMRSERFDMAVFEIDDPAFNYPSLKIGDPRVLQIGSPVIALGNPMGQVGYSSRGVINARAIVFQQNKVRLEMLRSSIMLAPGYSGGPTVNHAGEVVGISFSYFAHQGTRAYVNGNTIPIDLVVNTIERHLDGKPVEPVNFRFRFEQDWEIVNDALERPSGVLFLEGRTPVDDALGLRTGDVITDINGMPIVDTDDLARALLRVYPGDTVRIRIKGARNEEITTTIPLVTMIPAPLDITPPAQRAP